MTSSFDLLLNLLFIQYHYVSPQDATLICKNPRRSSLILSIQKERKQLHRLEMENICLREELQDYQYTLNVVMSKYRQYAANCNSNPMIKANYQIMNHCNSDIVESKQMKVFEMAQIMNEAIKIDEKRTDATLKIIDQLRAENELIRQLLSKAGIILDPKNSEESEKTETTDKPTVSNELPTEVLKDVSNDQPIDAISNEAKDLTTTSNQSE